MPRPLVINDELVVPGERLRLSFARSSGPGGQNVNKVNSKAILRWTVVDADLPADVLLRFRAKYGNRITQDGEVVIAADESRDQGANVRSAYARLRQMLLAVAAPPRPRKKSKPSRGSIERRLNQKRQASEKKQNRRRPPDSGE
ncbi:MAG: aminoacyl-tRNA hydrolase [Pirellulales bacterium]|nr:aminoacyl-tRNA hydrolase [Pirellulales bacterium]